MGGGRVMAALYSRRGPILLLSLGFYGGRQCGEYAKRLDRKQTFILEVAKSSLAVKVEVEVPRACEYATGIHDVAHSDVDRDDGVAEDQD